MMALLLFLLLGNVLLCFNAAAFSTVSSISSLRRRHPYDAATSKSTTMTTLFLRTGVQVPLLNLLDDDDDDDDDDDEDEDEDATNNNNNNNIITPLPSSHLPAEVATPFLYGMQVERPVHKLLLEEATMLSAAADADAADADTTLQLLQGGGPAPTYGHLVWKNKNSDSLVGAIGCTAEILIKASTTPTTTSSSSSTEEEVVLKPDMLLRQLKEKDKDTTKEETSSSTSLEPSSSETTHTILCRGGYRFVVKEIVKSIPYPVAIIDEIQDDAEEDDSDFFISAVNTDDEDDDDDDDDDDEEQYSEMKGKELIQKTMIGIQTIISRKLEDALSKKMTPLEKSILEETGVTVPPYEIEVMQAEETTAVWEVFQASLVDDIDIQDRKYAIAFMSAELADLKNDVRQQMLITRNAEERLRIVLKELDEINGMASARKFAAQITDKMDDSSKDLKIGVPQLPQWAKTIRKGNRVEYFWNEKYGWVAGEVIKDPELIVDELLLTIRFDDGETHTLPLTADEKVRWRPG